MAEIRHALNVKREDDFATWYQEVISAADMAEDSGVRGCMVIKPWGYGIWERIQRLLDEGVIKDRVAIIDQKKIAQACPAGDRQARPWIRLTVPRK